MSSPAAGGAVRIRPVENRSDLRTFIRFPWQIYRKHYPTPHWVPPLLVSEKALLSRDRSPFFEHGDAAYFLAEHNGKLVGRIAGIVNDLHTEIHEEPVGFFGFFECINDQEVAAALVDAAAAWVRERGLKVMRGPMNFSTNETCGLLTEGFDEPPTVMMTFNPPYYVELLTGAGMEPAKELLSYFVGAADTPERIGAVAKKARRSSNVEFRTMNIKRYKEEVALIKVVYNDAWERNWGFLPMTEAEMDQMANDLKPILDPDMVILAFVDGEVAGFSLSVPDINEILIHMNGRLLPFGIFKLLSRRRKATHVRVIALGVRRRYRRLGLGSVFYAESLRTALEKGYRSGEASWVLEDNAEMRTPLELMGGKINKRYMIYDLGL